MQKAFNFLLIIFLVNVASFYFDWYLKYFWFNMVLHFLGGFFMAMLMANYLKENISSGSKIKNMLVILGATIFVGVVWEFAEYIANQTLAEPVYKYFQTRVYFMGDLDDTVNDLFMDLMGALSFVFVYKNKLR